MAYIPREFSRIAATEHRHIRDFRGHTDDRVPAQPGVSCLRWRRTFRTGNCVEKRSARAADAQDIGPNTRVYNLQGVLYFGSVREFSERLWPANDPDEVIIDFKDARVADNPSLEALNAITERYRKAGKILRLRHLSTECQKMITAAGSLVEIEVADDDPHYTVARI